MARWHRSLLACGILAPVLYVAMTLFVGLLWEGYSVVSGVPSELAAIGAPTRLLWMWLGAIYAVLMVAFGWIVWKSAPPNRALRVVGALLIAHTVFGQFWPPMHQRAVLAAGGGTLTDTLHLVWAMVTGLFFVLIVGLGAAALGKRFRVYSIATMVISLASGVMTGTYASRVQADLPTPWVGVWERISIAAFMGWIAVLAIALLRAPHAAETPDRRSPTGMSRFPRIIRQLVGIVPITLLLSATGAGAQTAVEPSSNVGSAVGITVHRLQDNFGLSGTWSSPAFFDRDARITAGGGVAWYPYGTSASGDQDWVPFGHSRVVVESGHRVGRAPLRLYGFGGAMLVFRSERLSEDVLAVAGIGGFGFEFFAPANTINAPVSYFIEIGGIGSGARATNLPGHPIILNGFVVQSGLRFYP